MLFGFGGPTSWIFEPPAHRPLDLRAEPAIDAERTGERLLPGSVPLGRFAESFGVRVSRCLERSRILGEGLGCIFCCRGFCSFGFRGLGVSLGFRV